jgi:phosphatidylinositol alpha-mannosyltransferase
MVTEYAYPVLGGVPEHVHNLSLQLVRMGHEVTVVTANAPFRLRGRARRVDAENLREHGYRTVRLGISMPVRGNGSVARCAVGIGLKARIAKALEGMDVVHSQGMAHPSICLWGLRVATGPVNVGTFHTYFEGGHWGYRYLFAYVRSTVHRTDRMIVVSEACITALRPYFRDQPFQIIPNGVDTDLYRPLGPDEPRPSGPPRILFVGRLDPRNDLRTLLDAARILKDEGREFVVQVVGDGSGWDEGHRLADELDIADRIEWLGEQDKERPRLYREADVFAAPCTIASFGVVLLEALASGTPVVCADNIGFNQVIRDGMPGRFHTPRDPRDLAAGIGELLDDPARAAEWGRRGRELTEERYAWTSIAAQIAGVYQEIYDAKGGARRPHPPVGLRFNLRRNPLELIKGIPAALRAGDPEAPDGGVGDPRPDQVGEDPRRNGVRAGSGRKPAG